MNGPFEDLKILDFTTAMGSYCTKLFADLGADVLKIEPLEGDTTRHMGPFYKGEINEETSLYYMFMNTNKQSLAIDIKKEAGQEIIKKLIKKYDVIVENFAPGYLESLGIGYEDLKTINPKIIVTSITGFGQVGPYSQYNSSDLVGVAMGGLLHLGGYPDTSPIRPYGNQGYYAVSLYAAVGTLMAIYSRDIHKIGQQVDVSMQEAIALALENSVQFYDLEGTVRKRTGIEGGQAGWGLYPCKDGEVFIVAAGLGAQYWSNLIKWVKDNDVADWEKLDDKKWEDLDYRQSNEGKQEFFNIFTQLTLKKSKNELYEEGQHYGIAIGPVNDPKDLLNSPQLKAREFFVQLHHEMFDSAITYPGAPYRFNHIEWGLHPAPQKGENTETILRELGLSHKNIKHLKEGGVI